MLARRRPFAGESVSDVIAAVLEHSLPQVSRLDPKISFEIETVIGKALEKKAEKRFQTAQEFTAALRKAKSISENGNTNHSNNRDAFSNSFHSQKTFFTHKDDITAADTRNLSGLFIGGTKISWRAIALPVLLALLFFTGGWFYIYRPMVEQTPAKQIKIRRLTTTGNVTNAAISPDGRLIIFVQNNNGRQSLWLRQVDEIAAQELIPASAESYAGLTFAPDGNWIYYTIFSNNETGKLNRIRLLGGSPQEIAKDVDSAVSFAPDGKSFAFIRGNPKEGVDRIIVSNLEGGERILSERKRPEFYTIGARESLDWSPDGKYIACPFGQIGTKDEFMSVAQINVETGEEKPLTTAKWSRVGRVAWTKNSEELMVTAAEIGSELFHIVKIFRPDGSAKKVAGELNDYYNLSLNKDSTLMLGVSYDKTSNIYTASTEQPNQISQIMGGSFDGIGGVLWTSDGRIVYVSAESGNRDIWMMDSDGGNRKPLTFDKAADDLPSVSKDGNRIAFVSTRAGVPHVWRMNSEGGEQKQITDKGGENLPSMAPDGSFVIYSSRMKGLPVLWKVSIEGGEPAQLTKEQTNWSAISPNGKYIACLTRDNAPDAPTKLAIVSAETGDILNIFKTMGAVISPVLPTTIRWLPDGQAITYVANAEGVSNIWSQPVLGGAAKKVTDFTADKIFSFDWSKDGRKIVYSRGALRNDLVLIENF
jgi:Tol biopolymer transport system component